MTSSLTALVSDQLEGFGLPHENAHTFVKWFFTSDILSLAFRLAIVSLTVSLLKSRAHKARDYIYNSLFVTAHAAGRSCEWTLAYMYLDPDVQRQLLQYRLLADDSSDADPRKQGWVGNKRAGATWVQDGVCFRRSPLNSRTILIKIGGKKLWATRCHSGFGADTNNIDHFRFTTWKWDRQVITDFLLKAHDTYRDKNDNEIHIFNHTPKFANWEGPVIRPSRPWSSVMLPGTVKDDLLEDVKGFVSEEEKEWYASRGIPHRRGYLLHGPPGTGKTTLATALASKLRMDLYIVNPAAPGMDNGKLQKCFRNCPKGSLLLIEDIDCVMPVNRAWRNGVGPTSDDEDADGEDQSLGDVVQSKEGREPTSKNILGPSSVTLSGLLNAIDGVASQEDSVLFASTNYPNKLDEALRRPGRFDVHVAFDYAVTEQAKDMYKHFYPVQQSSPLDEKSSTEADEADAEKRASEFAVKTVGKGIKVSVAAIQGYLLLHKKDSAKALEKAEEWADGIKDEQEEVEKKKPQVSAVESVRAMTPPATPQ